ncbi:MAG: PTS sugar transporter subunit IIA [bacterium]
MTLDVKKVAKLLAVSEKTVYQWIARSEIPFYKIGQSYQFNKVELLEWASAKKIQVSYQIFEETLGAPESMPSLTEAIQAGGIYYDVSGTDRESVLKSIVRVIHLPSEVDRTFLVQALIERENLEATTIGDGIAIPHVRNPIISHVNQPILALCFLKQGIDFKALDQKPVNTVFTIITPTIRSHLYVLSRLSYVLQQPDFRRIISDRSGPSEILSALTNLEKTLTRKPSKG